MKIAHNYYVYIVECNDKSYYIGVTNNIERRLWEHNYSDNKLTYTFGRRPVILKYCQRFQDITQAIAWEKQMKG
jgi:putative endonuclease